MNSFETRPVLRIALPTPLRRLFDYLPPQGLDYNLLKPGIRVRVPFQSRQLVGVLVSLEKKSSVAYEKLKTVSAILDSEPILSGDVWQLCCWAADYYHYALGEVLMSALPKLLRSDKETRLKPLADTGLAATESPLVLNEAQQIAVDAIAAAHNQFKAFLLDGVTGSGKTEVYLHAMAHVIQQGKQILMLVPEISLTPQTIERLRARFSVPMVVLHSGLSEKKRLQAWLAAKSGEAKIVIGTRSAVFTSFAQLGLIIVDEEHDASFKQQDRFRYHARDLAIMRANQNNIPIVLGSATPSLESLQNEKRGRYTLLSLPNRAGSAALPGFHLIDLRKCRTEEGLSLELLQLIDSHLQQNNQVMLFLNRRGFSPVLYCTQCAAMVECKRCDARMVYHRAKKRLHCHHCDTKKPVPLRCENCNEESLQPVGIGTQRLEEALQTHFPDIPLIRVDRDSTQRKDAMQDLLQQIHTQPRAILLGTQMLAKGHHFPNVTLVAIVDADAGLFSADFRASEQMGQLLMQAAGRAGRASKRGTVAIQTRHPDHPLLQTLIQKGYQTFAQTLLTEREVATLPPFSWFAVFRAEAYAEKNALNFLNAIKEILPSDPSLAILGPVSALMAKRNGLHCQHLLLKTSQRSILQKSLKNILSQCETMGTKHAVKWVLDIDPIEV